MAVMPRGEYPVAGHREHSSPAATASPNPVCARGRHGLEEQDHATRITIPSIGGGHDIGCATALHTIALHGL
ncbi:MAG: hypothetical protein K0V04_31245 [Deltaproteobacteria bacterium]|nr:hypothetical protein [Deltaproteobacteria bacterium]